MDSSALVSIQRHFRRKILNLRRQLSSDIGTESCQILKCFANSCFGGRFLVKICEFRSKEVQSWIETSLPSSGWLTCGYTARSHKLPFLRDLKAPRVWMFDNNDMPWYRKKPKRQISQKEPTTADSQTWPKKRSFPGTTGSGSRTTSPTLATSATTPTGTTWSWRWAWQVGQPNYPD